MTRSEDRCATALDGAGEGLGQGVVPGLAWLLEGEDPLEGHPGAQGNGYLPASHQALVSCAPR